MDAASQFPGDFQNCVRFHGHACPGLAIGYAAAKAATLALGIGFSEDEEIVAIVENDSCSVDAIQVLLGCTFGKGNLIFRDWGKQVFTILDRKTGRGVRVSYRRGPDPSRRQRVALKEKIDSGKADADDVRLWEELRRKTIIDLVNLDPKNFFDTVETQMAPPPTAVIASTAPCDSCGEETVASKLGLRSGLRICQECRQRE
jgi:formylmethanofuran dehydrogenase subunit E